MSLPRNYQPNPIVVNMNTLLQASSGKTRGENALSSQENRKRRAIRIVALFCGALITVALTSPMQAQTPVAEGANNALAAQTSVAYPAELETGFHLLYELKPIEARAQFDAWQQAHPEDPLGPALQAANYLLEECYRQGVLTSEYFLNDKNSGKKRLNPNAADRQAFVAAYQQALDLARARLKAAPNDVNALFAISMSLGLEADYAALIDKRGSESLSMMKDSANYARQLLAINPEFSDAYLALGAANYIIGSLSGTQRFFLGFSGIHGNEKEGMKQLEIAATRGHYLRPFAKMLLALATLRQKKPEVARTQFAELAAEFPANPLFVSELAKLTGSSTPSAEGRTGP